MKIFRRFKFGMLRLTNWFVGDMNFMKYVTETQGTLTLQNIPCPDFQNLNNFLYFNFVKNLANSRLPKSVISVIEIL